MTNKIIKKWLTGLLTVAVAAGLFMVPGMEAKAAPVENAVTIDGWKITYDVYDSVDDFPADEVFIYNIAGIDNIEGFMRDNDKVAALVSQMGDIHLDLTVFAWNVLYPNDSSTEFKIHTCYVRSVDDGGWKMYDQQGNVQTSIPTGGTLSKLTDFLTARGKINIITKAEQLGGGSANSASDKPQYTEFENTIRKYEAAIRKAPAGSTISIVGDESFNALPASSKPL